MKRSKLAQQLATKLILALGIYDAYFWSLKERVLGPKKL